MTSIHDFDHDFGVPYNNTSLGVWTLKVGLCVGTIRFKLWDLDCTQINTCHRLYDHSNLSMGRKPLMGGPRWHIV